MSPLSSFTRYGFSVGSAGFECVQVDLHVLILLSNQVYILQREHLHRMATEFSISCSRLTRKYTPAFIQQH